MGKKKKISYDTPPDFTLEVKAGEFSDDGTQLYVRGYAMFSHKRLISSEFRSKLEHTFLIGIWRRRFRFISSEERNLFDTLCLSDSEIYIKAFYYAESFPNIRRQEQIDILRNNLYVDIPLSEFTFDRSTDSFIFAINVFSIASKYLALRITSSEILNYVESEFKYFVSDSVLSLISKMINAYFTESIDCSLSLQEIYTDCIDDIVTISVPSSDFYQLLPWSTINRRIIYRNNTFIDSHHIAQSLLGGGLCICENIPGINKKKADFSGTEKRLSKIICSLDNSYFQSLFNNAIRHAFSKEVIENSFIISDSKNKVYAISPLWKFTSYKQIPFKYLRQRLKDDPSLNVYYFQDPNIIEYEGEYGQPERSFITYLTAKNCNGYWTITIYPMFKGLSVYSFNVEKKDIRLAQFFIWAYFSSNLSNKRQFFWLKNIFSQIGIFYFSKCGTLSYSKKEGFDY